MYTRDHENMVHSSDIAPAVGYIGNAKGGKISYFDKK